MTIVAEMVFYVLFLSAEVVALVFISFRGGFHCFKLWISIQMEKSHAAQVNYMAAQS